METRYLQDRFRVPESETLVEEVERVLSSISLSYARFRSIYVPVVEAIVVNGSTLDRSGDISLPPITTIIYEYPEGSVFGQFSPRRSIPMIDRNNIVKGHCTSELLYIHLPPRLTEAIDDALPVIRRQDL
ncbi:hypothetical protein HY495_02460 [Candidatus Woesearchaeota archaeon]|nr:hypothetical protein [Candidatus Woesearchaeota archaeon]